jgi:thiamine-monophosphate kinase
LQDEESILRRLAELAGNADIFNVDAAGPQGLLINIDGYAASMSRLPFMSWSDWGYKSTVASASDIIASGGRPIAIAYSVGATSVDVLEEVAKGVGEASRDVRAKVYKADSNRSTADAWIDVAVVGTTSRPVTRSGATPGDVVVQVGYLGYGSLAYKIMKSEVSLRDVEEDIIRKMARPRPHVDAAEAISRYAHASSDNSDGWLVTLNNIARSSGVLISLEEVVVDPQLEGLLTAEESIMSWEDYNLAVAVPAGSLDDFLKLCGSLCFAVGKVREGRGVEFRGKPLESRGWSWW